jgi:hypothetical protein
VSNLFFNVPIVTLLIVIVLSVVEPNGQAYKDFAVVIYVGKISSGATNDTQHNDTQHNSKKGEPL